MLEDVQYHVPESVICYDRTMEKFIRSETVMAAQLMKLSEIVKAL